MSQKKAKKVRKHLNDNHHACVEARWRRPMRWLPGLKSDWFGIMLFPKFQPLFKYRMIHAITTGPDACPKCGGSGKVDRPDIIATTKETVAGHAAEVEYTDKNGVVVGYWAYGSFDPQYSDPFKCDCQKPIIQGEGNELSH